MTSGRSKSPMISVWSSKASGCAIMRGNPGGAFGEHKSLASSLNSRSFEFRFLQVSSLQACCIF